MKNNGKGVRPHRMRVMISTRMKITRRVKIKRTHHYGPCITLPPSSPRTSRPTVTCCVPFCENANTPSYRPTPLTILNDSPGWPISCSLIRFSRSCVTSRNKSQSCCYGRRPIKWRWLLRVGSLMSTPSRTTTPPGLSHWRSHVPLYRRCRRFVRPRTR